MQSQSKTGSKATKPEKADPKEPKEPPKRRFFPPALMSFWSNSEQIVLGDTNKHNEKEIQVALTNKHIGTDAPFIGYRIKLERHESTVHLYDGEKHHTVLFKYHRDEYALTHRKATDAEKLGLIKSTNDNPNVIRACQLDKLYIVQFFLNGKEGPEIHGIGSSFVGANDQVSSIYKHLSSISSCQEISLYLFEYGNLPLQLDWMVADQASRTDPLLHYYRTSKTGQPQGYVQWNQLRPRDETMEKAFDRRDGCHNFGDFTVLYGCSEAYETQHFFELSRQLRETKVHMSVFAPKGSNDDFYVAFISIPDWHRFQHVLMPFDELRVCFEPPPIIKPQSEKAQGEKDPKDNAPGWPGRVMEDNALFQDAPLTVLIKRPGEGLALCDKKMPSVNDTEQPMPTIAVYLKTFPSAITVKARLKAIDKHTRSKNPGIGFDRKRRLLVGRDLSVDYTVDLLEKIPLDKIEELTANLNDSQRKCIQTHCRQVPNGLNLIHGPFGSGKTVLVAMLCELQALRVAKSKTFIACSSNSACDAVVPKFKGSGSTLMVVRAHAMSLERENLLKEYFVKGRNGKLREADELPADYEDTPVVQKIQQPVSIEGAETIEVGPIEEGGQEDVSDHGGDTKGTDAPTPKSNDASGGGNEEWGEVDKDAVLYDGEAEKVDDDIPIQMMLQADLEIMKLCQKAYSSKTDIFYPPDKRMVCIEVSIHTWMLKFAGIVDSEWSMKPDEIQISQGMPDPWAQFRHLYSKTHHQHLNEAEWKQFKRCMTDLANAVLRAADVVIATAVQGELGLFKDIKFDQVIMDEMSVVTMGELLCSWRDLEVLTLIGDINQLPATVLTTPTENPFSVIQSYGPFQRWSSLGVPVFLLKEVMRMTAGLEAIANEIFYDAKLVRGPGTELDHPQRGISRRLQPLLHETFPTLTGEPEGLVYPVFFDVRGMCVTETGGTSKMNHHNIAFIIQQIQRLLSGKDIGLKASDFGIACPYSAQRRAMRKALYKAGIKEVSVSGFINVEVGTAEFWQGKESEIMIVDLVRAGSSGDLGFMGKKERLNVLLTRQRQHLFVVGDATCCDNDLALEQYEAAVADLMNPSNDAPNDATNDASNDATDDVADKKTQGQGGRKNQWVMKVIQWFQEKGRVVTVAMEDLSQEFVTFDTEAVDDSAGGWGTGTDENGGVTVDAQNEIGEEEVTEGNWDAGEVDGMGTNAEWQ